jgi:Skp family chaperone for outer membrane proteins
MLERLRNCGLVFLLAGLSVMARAEDQPSIPAPVIGVVDVDEIMQESLAGKAVREQASKYRQQFQSQGAAEENALRATQQAIEQERKTLAPAALSERVHAFDASVAEYQRKDLARRRAYEKSFNSAMSRVQLAMNNALAQYAETHGINIVLPNGQVLLFDKKMGITKDIIALMDKAQPTVDFPPPQLEQDPAALGTTPAPSKKKN